MAVIRVQGRRLAVAGRVGYDEAGRFSAACRKFLTGPGRAGGSIDLGGAEELVSPCLAALYDGARLHRPEGLSLVVPERLAHLFAPAEIEGLFTVTVARRAAGRT